MLRNLLERHIATSRTMANILLRTAFALRPEQKKLKPFKRFLKKDFVTYGVLVTPASSVHVHNAR